MDGCVRLQYVLKLGGSCCCAREQRLPASRADIRNCKHLQTELQTCRQGSRSVDALKSWQSTTQYNTAQQVTAASSCDRQELQQASSCSTCICDVPETALLWRDLFLPVLLLQAGGPDVDVGVPGGTAGAAAAATTAHSRQHVA